MSEAFEYPELIDRAISAYENDDGAERIRAGFEVAVTRPVTLRANTAKASAEGKRAVYSVTPPVSRESKAMHQCKKRGL